MMGTSNNNTVMSKVFLNPDGSELSGSSELGYTQTTHLITLRLLM